MLNIINLENNALMLGSDLPTYMEAHYWLDYYRSTYYSGKEYPNGQGVYTGEFVICRRCCDCGDYFIIQ